MDTKTRNNQSGHSSAVSLRGIAVLISSLIIVAAVMATPLSISAQGKATPIPLVTLVPPTLVPTIQAPTATPTFTQSALAHIKSKTKKAQVRVGILYNIGRFSSLTDVGTVDGFEPDLAVAIADDWGAVVNYQQVTQHNGRDMLLSGQIDLLMGEVPLVRDDTQLDYSMPFFVSKDVALVNGDSPAKSITDLGGQTIGVVQGSRSEQSVNGWVQANGLQATVKDYPMLDGPGGLLQGLINKQVAAVAADRWDLDQHVNGVIQGVRLLEGVFQSVPYAIAMRRYDDNLRTLVNRTLQRLAESKRIDPIYDTNFQAGLLTAGDRPDIPVWTGLDDDKRSIDDFPTDIVMPAQSVVERIKAKQPIRVAGLGAPPDANGNTPLLENFNQAILNEMGRRWGVQMQAVPNSYSKGEDAVASGQADLGVGVEPHWGSVDRVDFTAAYAQHSYRMMIVFGGSIRSFGDLLSTRRQLGYFADDPGAVDLMQKYATAAHLATINPIKLDNDQDGITRLTSDHTVDIIFGDSLRLYPVVQAFPKYVQLTDTEYGGGKQIAFAVPHNDADFRDVVDITLQDMARDGTYQKIWQANFGIGQPLTITIWPGTSQPFGVKTSG
ncbi:MAG TPA: transporter substrate-binding domain-containing protein [Aggregatilineales bacterium]|nr:transporter substrate-binding domain-containing protein [Aggregatilineales bacterium]